VTISELIEQLEAIRTELQPRRLSPSAYESVGWADRPLRMLIDQAREEQEAQAFRDARAAQFVRSVLPRGTP